MICCSFHSYLFDLISLMVFSLCYLFVKQSTAYEMRIGDWSSDVCSSDLHEGVLLEEDRSDERDLAEHRNRPHFERCDRAAHVRGAEQRREAEREEQHREAAGELVRTAPHHQERMQAR